MTLEFDKDFDPAPGLADAVSPLVRRILAPNPGPYTFRGTNTYLVGHGRHVAVVDPGPADDAHLAAILGACAGETITHVFVTHTHADHSPCAAALVQRTGAATYGFGPHPPARAELITGLKSDEGRDRDFEPIVRVHHGDAVGCPQWTIEAVHTPGHLANHLCFALVQEGSLFTGDHVMGWSTSVIDPNEGDLGDFLASLDLLLGRKDERYWSAHGAVIAQPHRYVEALRTHRLERNDQVLARLGEGPVDVTGLVAAIYPELDEKLVPAAKATMLAHLVHLERAGQVAADGAHGVDTVYARR